MLVGGVLCALILIWRYATKKVKRHNNPQYRGVMIGGIRTGAPAANHAGGASLGTIAVVNVIGLAGMLGTGYCYTLDDPLARLFLGFGCIFVAAWLGMKVVEATEAQGTITPLRHLMGIIAMFCVLGWWFATLNYCAEIGRFFSEKMNG